MKENWLIYFGTLLCNPPLLFSKPFPLLLSLYTQSSTSRIRPLSFILSLVATASFDRLAPYSNSSSALLFNFRLLEILRNMARFWRPFGGKDSPLTMAASPARFLFGFFFVSIILWIAFIFVAWLLALALSHIMGASVRFRVGGWKCLRDVVVKFKKGTVESISVGEIRLSLRQSLANLGFGFLSKDPKLQMLISDLEVVLRPSIKEKQKCKSRKPRRSGTGRGKWMAFANVARFLSVSVSDLALKTSKTTLEIKEFRVDISKDGSTNSNLFFKLFVSYIAAYMGEEQVSVDPATNLSDNGGGLTSQNSVIEEKAFPLFNCEELSLSCEFGHDREVGVAMKDLDIICGGIMMNLSEKLLLKSRSPSKSKNIRDTVAESAIDQNTTIDPQKKQGLIMKYSTLFPEKASFSLPKLGLRFVHHEQDLFAENEIMGVQLKSWKSQTTEDGGESVKLDVQLDLSEIHLFREADTSVLEVLKVNVSSSVYIPIQETSVIRAEIDVCLGGTQCHVLLSRLNPWMRLLLLRKKKIVLKEEIPKVEKAKSTSSKSIMWTCTVSAPEMTIVLYSMNGLPLFHGCSQSSHVFANNVSNAGNTVHTELGEINLHISDEYQECSKESLFGVETNSGSLLHIAKISLDWGRKEAETVQDKDLKSAYVLSVDVTGMGVYLNMKRMESMIAAAMSLEALAKTFSGSKNKLKNGEVRSSKSSGKGTRVFKVTLERCSINYSGDVALDNTVVEDPKRVNYGSQGGRVVVCVSDDGTKRTADIISTVSDECKKLKYSVSLEIFHFTFCLNKEKNSVQMELERAKSNYQEHPEEPSLGTKVLLLDMQNAKFVRRSGGLKEIAVCSLFSATDIAVRWEPDVHISLFELMLHLKLLVRHHKLQALDNNLETRSGSMEIAKEPTKETSHAEKQQKKESVFAVDVEMLRVSAEAGDGVETTIQVQSIFSENARIGVLLEGLMLCFDGCQVFRSSRMQVSRIPNALSSPGATIWDWVVQGLDVHICMPYRLQLRAIDDAVEDQLRAVKLMTSAKRKLIFPVEKKNSQPKKSFSAFGCLKFFIRKLTADIEEEPLQGWLDEHYQLMKNEACELAVRLKFLDDLVSTSSSDKCPGASDSCEATSVKRIAYRGVDTDLQDPSVVSKLRDEIYQESFRSYYQACQNLKAYKGSGAWRDGFQAGFRPSTDRASLLSIFATDLDLSLMKIDGGEAGMVDVVKELDPIARENNIPFSRLYGSKINMRTSTLVVQLRNYTFPIFSATHGKCEGRLVLAQQATCFQPQIHQEVFVGRWRKVRVLRSATGTTPPMKTYADLPLHFQKGELSFGVGYEPSFTDISWAFTVALRRANISVKNPKVLPSPPKKEKSLPWWDETRNYIHGHISLYFSESHWYFLATTDPYEKLDKLQFVSGSMEIQQSDGSVIVSAKDFKVFTSSLECLAKNRNLKFPSGVNYPFLEVPWFTLEVKMDWGCDSGTPLNHYLFALPNEGRPREYVFDPFRSTSLSLRWNFSFRPPKTSDSSQPSDSSNNTIADGSLGGSYSLEDRPPTFNVGAHDLEWIIKFWYLNYLPPQKLRSFSRWPRFGVPRVPRSGNLSLDRVMTEFMLRVDSTPSCIKNIPLDDDDPAKGLIFKMTKLKFELVNSRGKQKYTFDTKREPLDQVYQGLDLHMPKVHLDRDDCLSVAKLVQVTRKASLDRGTIQKSNSKNACTDRQRDDGFLLSSDYFTIRKQSAKADPARLLAWQEAGRKNPEMTYVRSEFENGSDSDEHMRSDPSDDDGYNVVIADSCQRIFVYGLKLLWNIENRDAVWSWVGGLSKAFAPPKPSPSRQYTQRKILEKNQKIDGLENTQDDKSYPTAAVDGISLPKDTAKSSEPVSSASNAIVGNSSSKNANDGNINEPEEGTRHFMINVVEPQFNLHSEEANGRFLLAAVSGRVLARSFHSVLQVGQELIEKALGSGSVQIRDSQPQVTWKRMELSAMLEHVQAHVAPTDVDPGAGLQWLPKIRRSSPKVKRTGALLERVFMPCDMYFRYTRHKGGTPDLKVKPLKELTFNSRNITATMTSRQFQVMLDVLTNLLFARTPKPRRSTLLHPAEDDEDVEQEADEVVPDGVEEVELARVSLEQKEREQKLLLYDIRKLLLCHDASGDLVPEQEGDLWMVASGRSTLVKRLRIELGSVQKSRKSAIASLRMALQRAAEMRLMEKEKNKSPSYAMRISLQINKVVWSMLVDGKAFAEAEINDMIYDFDRDYKDIGVARFTIKSFVVRDCFPNTKSDMLLCAWNPPPEWGKKVMLRIDAKQGAPKDGRSPIELFQVDIYPLKIHLTDLMYRTMWDYLFPEEEQDSQRRQANENNILESTISSMQEVWKVSTTAGLKRVKKGSAHEASVSAAKEPEGSSKSSTSALAPSADPPHGSKQNTKSNAGSTSQLRRTSSFDRTWEENLAESVTNELMSHTANEDESAKGKTKDSKAIKPGRASHEEKRVGKANPESKTRPRKMIEFRNVKISQVELQVTFEDLKIPVTDLRLLMDEFHRPEFVGTWKRLFSRIRKHVIWGVLKSVTGMQMKKFKDKAHNHKEIRGSTVPDELNLSDSDGGPGEKSEQYPISFLKRPAEGAGDGFVTSVRGLFNTQRRKAKQLILRTMRGEQEDEIHGEWSENEAEFSPFARQLTITKAKRLLRRHTKKFRSRKGTSQQKDSLPSSPKETTIYEGDSSSGSSPYEDFHD
ncbi:hypothetical protein V2J09_007628 [Rumex salicifolius]